MLAFYNNINPASYTADCQSHIKETRTGFNYKTDQSLPVEQAAKIQP